jgi:ATP-dependent RNA helicase DeaD
MITEITVKDSFSFLTVPFDDAERIINDFGKLDRTKAPTINRAGEEKAKRKPATGRRRNPIKKTAPGARGRGPEKKPVRRGGPKRPLRKNLRSARSEWPQQGHSGYPVFS